MSYISTTYLLYLRAPNSLTLKKLPKIQYYGVKGRTLNICTECTLQSPLGSKSAEILFKDSIYLFAFSVICPLYSLNLMKSQFLFVHMCFRTQ
jgi:hypothetical protein